MVKHARPQGRMKHGERDARTILLSLTGGGAVARQRCGAQDYPSRPITLVVPYAAGGGNDVMARIVAEKMSQHARPADRDREPRRRRRHASPRARSRKAAPDGYTLVIGGTGTLAINPTLYQQCRLRPAQGFRAGRPDRHRARWSCWCIPTLPVHSIARTDRARQARAGQAQLRLGRRRQRHPSRHRAVRADGRHQAHPRSLQGHRPGAHRSASAAMSRSISARCRRAIGLVTRRQGARAGGDRRQALGRVSRSADGRRSRPAGLRGGAALRHRRAGRHAAADRRQAQRGAARGARRRTTSRSGIATDGTEPLPRTPEEYAADIDREETKWSAIVKKSGAKAE